MRVKLITKLAMAIAVSTAASASVALPASAAPGAAASSRHAAPTGSAIAESARAAALSHRVQAGLAAKSGLVASDVMVDASGKQHVRFSQTYRGIPVEAADIVVHLDAASRYLGVTRASATVVSLPSVHADVTEAQARGKAASRVNRGVAGAAALVVNQDDGRSTLSYRVQVVPSDGAIDRARTVLVDAASGAVLSSRPAADGFISPQVYDKLRAAGEHAAPAPEAPGRAPAAPPSTSAAAAFPSPASGTGNSIFSGSVPLNTTQTGTSTFTLVDGTRGNSEVRDGRHTSSVSSTVFNTSSVLTDADNVWGNGSTTDNATPAVDAQYGLASTYDFYKATFNRNGIANDGVGSHGVVHFSTNYGNAAWYDGCHCMLYGDGDGQTFTKPLVQLDVTGHELTHGVVSSTARLQPSSNAKIGNEPGALNESLADIFASGVEFGTANPRNPGNYLVGEQLGLAQTFLRRLDHPSLDKLEGAIDYWSTTTPRTEVHAGSGVSSHAFYLLAEGSGSKTINGVAYNSPTVDGQSVTGIGRGAALAIFYQALTRYMVSTTNFHAARTATLNAAADLYGSGSTQYNAVNRAWAAVNVTASNG
ncbi:M4 family metallopeptidase [Streptomyces sp. NPDC093675]|uniref:M4 family metallopeptidase n=1 Tax=Streptomyces sp. NPDC093675 TaxID=3366049 RepID=UPI003805CC55